MNKDLIKAERESIPGIIKKEREELGMSQEELAGLCGVKRETIYRIEQGKFLPNLDLFLLIIHHLKCKILITKSK